MIRYAPVADSRERALPGSRLTRVSDTDQMRPRGGRLPRKARRAQLLDSALEVFVAQGYHAAAMDDIAERAGVSKPVLYQHFPGKLDLYLALLDASCDTIIDNCRAALASTTDNKDRVAATMKVFYSYVASEEGAFRLVFESDLTSEPDVRERVDRVTTAIFASRLHHKPGDHLTVNLAPADRRAALACRGRARARQGRGPPSRSGRYPRRR